MPITCRHRRLKVGREDNARRQTARVTLAVPPRQARETALNSLNGLPGSGVCYTAAWLISATKYEGSESLAVETTPESGQPPFRLALLP